MAHEETLPLFPFARPNDGPPPQYEDFRKSGLLQKVRLPNGKTAWLATRYEDVRALLADSRVSSDPRKEGYPQLTASRPVVTTTEAEVVLPINYQDPPTHTRFRRALMPEFTLARVQGLQPMIEATIADLLDKMLAHGAPVDLLSQFALAVPTTVILKLMGIPYEEHTFFHERAIRVVATHLDPAEAKQAQEEIRGRMLEVMREKEKDLAAHDDIIGRLIRDHIQTGNLSYAEACSLCQTLVIAGHETTATTIALGTFSLLQNPELYARLRDDSSMKLVGQTVEEMLRFWTIAHYIGLRVATADIEFGGVTIKAGDGILAQIMGANHDPAVFAHPEKFDIDRQTKSPHLAFGFGIHQCIGQQLARMELRAVFNTLPKRIPTLRLAVPVEQVEFRQGALAHGLNALPVTW